MTDELPAVLALIELSLCSCKTNCCSNRCVHRYVCVGCGNEDDDQSDEEIYLSDALMSYIYLDRKLQY